MIETPDKVKILVADLLLERNEARAEVKKLQDEKSDLENVQCDLQNALNDILKLSQEGFKAPIDINCKYFDRIIDICKRQIGEGWPI